MTHPLKFGLKASGQAITIEQLRACWRIAEEAGFDHLWDFDHLASIGPVGPDRPIYEGWALQAAMAEATKRVRIGCMVTGNTYRHPVVLAKLAVTVDHLSGGRLEFGIGAAWAEIEHQMYGIEGLDHRVGRLSESLQIIRSLWTEDRTTFEGRYYQLKDAIANPKPLQKPYPPIWIGASGDATLRLAARHADVWNIAGGGPDEVRAMIARFEEACAAVGRDSGEVRRSLQYDWDGKNRQELVDLSGRLLELGVTEQVLYVRGQEPVQLAEKIAEALPDLRKAARVAT
ncbi:MAG TPA: TIGR03560 family F420-dependent LLM class oxidoreductase [Candidatus Limnocylindrales bacterium]|nr:TIGR03560 family F420-dependent LLM class oxidoreductase [Candidatus Limnocylindrales bacterium]